MKRKLSFLFLSALTIPFFMVSCSDDKEEQEVKQSETVSPQSKYEYLHSIHSFRQGICPLLG